jgi:thiazole/oxazole-forming peptide maturase SagD family component
MAHHLEVNSLMIDRLIPIDPGHDCPVRVAAAVLKPDPWGRRRVVSGRGWTDQEAAERTLFEAVERHSAVFDDAVPMVRATAQELGADAVDVERLLLFSKSQHGRAAAWNAMVDGDHRWPRPFDPHQVIAWVRPQTGPFLPAACCYLGYPDALFEGFPVPDSSGLAASERAAEAESRALLELAERDAVAIWWYGRINRPTLQVDPADLPLLRAFEEWSARAGRRFWLLDLTHDLGIPTAAAVTCGRDGRDISLGFGAGLTAEDAAHAAMGELAQFDATKSLHKMDPKKDEVGLMAWCASADVAAHPHLNAHRGILSAPAMHGLTAKERLRERGIESFILNLPDHALGLKTVRAVAPGLRPIWPRFAPGRLYDVPHTLGWTVSKITELELNPVPILY